MSRLRKAWLYGAATAAVYSVATIASAQTTPNFGSGLYREDAASALARYLRMVTANPRDLEALTGAGRAALDVGDAQAAIGFYARAEALAPRNGRVKAGLGSALVLLNQEQAALKYFDEATDLGVPETDIASDRGLAYDLRGNAKRAQRDYGIALKRGDDPETTRRLAYSMAISGDSNGALVLLDPLLRKQDTAAWRARAFILAMAGDTAGANKAAEAVMPASTAAGFGPFFRKLPSLRPGEKAAAVHFGNFPGENRPMRIDDLFNQAEVAARVALENTPRSATDAGRVDMGQGAFGRLATRTPDAEGQLSTRSVPRPTVQAPLVVTPRANAPSLRPSNEARIAAALTPAPVPALAPSPALPVFVEPKPIVSVPVRVAVAPPVTLVPVPAPFQTNPVPSAATRPIVTGPVPGFGNSAVPTVQVAPGPQAPAPDLAPPATSILPIRLADVSATVRAAADAPIVQSIELPPSAVTGLPITAEPSVAPTVSPAPIATTRLADVAEALSAVPRSAPGATSTAVPPPPRPKVETASASVPPVPKPKVEVAKPSPIPPAKPGGETESRVWVQVAGGADTSALPLTWRRLKGKAPDLLDTQTAWTTPLKATNRLLVGPFASEREAQEFVNKLKPKGIDAFSWTSPKDQAIAKLASR